ncbi:hypothetical protein Bca52824_033909 [Brassica carinata]|uniref:Uncharacterized protein n=1 Tax=Brassica carinata TaxID=52824 RepID=A0A8X7SDH1_BRACI|nr:hypothetical protein Bca52824_033909 [Brassica carinata]
MDLAQRLLVAEARGQFRGDDDGQEAVDARIIPISYYPGNIFTEEGPLEVRRIRPPIVEGQGWPNVESTRSTVSSVQDVLRGLVAHGVTFIIPTPEQRPWSPPKGYQCVYESYFQDDTKLWFPIPRIVTAYAFRRGIALSQLMNGTIRLMVVLSVIAAEAGTSLSVRSFEELTSVSVTDGLVSTRMRTNYNVVTGYPSKTTDWQRSYFYVKSNRSAFEEPPKTSYRVLWNSDMVIHPNIALYPEDWRQSARIVASRRQDCWKNFSSDRIRRSIDWISAQKWTSTSVPYINSARIKKRLALFTSAEQKEIIRARTMKELPDLSLIVSTQVVSKGGAPIRGEGTSGPREENVAPAPTEQTPTGGPSKKKGPKQKKTSSSRTVPEGGENVEEVPVTDPPKKKDKNKRKRPEVGSGTQSDNQVEPESSPVDVAPKKKKPKKKSLVKPHVSSVVEEELQDLAPENVMVGHDSDDDENQTVASRIRRRDGLIANENVSGTPLSDRGAVGNLGVLPVSEGESGRLLERSPSRSQGGSETRVLGRPRETPGDEITFRFKRELPLVFYPEECGRLVQLVKGGPDELPPVADLAFGEDYKQAACSSIRNQGDWNVVIGKYDMALRRAQEQLRESEEGKERLELAHEEALREAIRERDAAIVREKALRREFNETRTADAAKLQMCKESVKDLEHVVGKLERDKAELEEEKARDSLKHAEEAGGLWKSRKYELTHERIRVMIAMIAKAERCFHRIRLREEQRDKYDDARCLYSQAFGTRKCLEQIRDSGADIPQATIDTYAEQEKHFREEAARLEVKEIPEDYLRLSPLVLESRFLIEDVWGRIDPYGSNTDLIDSEAAFALRTPRSNSDLPPERCERGLIQPAGSSNLRADHAAAPVDEAVPPTIVIVDSSAKASGVGSSSASSSGNPKTGGENPAGPRAGLPPQTFGRVSGPSVGE